MSLILGISALYHDSAAALIENGNILSAVQEERFTRVKHDPSFPMNSIKYILKENNIRLADIQYVVFYDKPFLKFERLLETYVSIVPKGFKSFKKAMPIWLREKLFLKNLIINELRTFDKSFNKDKLLVSEHHFSHAASAYYPSPFKEAIVLTLDGVGEWATTTVAIGKGKDLNIIKEINFPHSLGLLYSAFTYYLGFKVNSGEYKIMGLAPYGKPIYRDIILREIIDVKSDGSFKINQKYFDYLGGLTMTNYRFEKLFKNPVRTPDKENLTQFHMNVASSIQKVTEEVLIKISYYLKSKFNIQNLCIAGGVALNCVANGKILKKKIFKNIWVQPAAGDAGGALGAALGAWHKHLNNDRLISENKYDSMKGSYLGPEFSNDFIESYLLEKNIKFTKHEDQKFIDTTAKILSEGNAIGWFQGKMEFGPRSLGARSILADPRDKNMQKNLNLKVKFRESFRPFAPAVLYPDLSSWFEMTEKSPYMLFVSDIKKQHRIKMNDKDSRLFGIDKLNVIRSNIPAITHVDYSGRIQTVHEETNFKFYKLIESFKKITGCPIIVNTSFNVRGEPIVCSPEDALNCFLGTQLDFLAIGNFIINKKDIHPKYLKNYKEKYQLD